MFYDALYVFIFYFVFQHTSYVLALNFSEFKMKNMKSFKIDNLVSAIDFLNQTGTLSSVLEYLKFLTWLHEFKPTKPYFEINPYALKTHPKLANDFGDDTDEFHQSKDEILKLHSMYKFNPKETHALSKINNFKGREILNGSEIEMEFIQQIHNYALMNIGMIMRAEDKGEEIDLLVPTDLKIFGDIIEPRVSLVPTKINDHDIEITINTHRPLNVVSEFPIVMLILSRLAYYFDTYNLPIRSVRLMFSEENRIASQVSEEEQNYFRSQIEALKEIVLKDLSLFNLNPAL